MKPSADLWEDWPAVSALPSSVREASPDFELAEQIGWVDDRPMLVQSQTLSDHSQDIDPSSIRKADASILARSRQDGDLWVAVSDDPASASDSELFPRGSDLAANGTVVRLDGVDLTSVCRYDFIAKILVDAGRHSLVVSNLDRTAWLRVIKIRLPFHRSQILVSVPLPPARESTVPFDC